MASAPIEATVDTVDPGVLVDLAGYHLRRASSAFASDFTRALAGTGMRQVLFGILSVVAANPKINQGSVGRHLGIKRANMVSLINELVYSGLVERHTSAEDRRAFALALTASGHRMLEECLTRIHAHERHMLENFNAAERKQFIALLNKIERRED